MKSIARLLAAALVPMLMVPVQAEVAAPPAEAPRAWTDKAEMSLVSTNGNSKGTTTSVKNLYKYNWSAMTALEIGAGALGSNSKDGVTAENYNANEKATWHLVGKTYLFERFGWDKDRFAGIRNRYDGSAGFGRAILALPSDQLNAELGGGYINEERVASPRNDYPSGRGYLKYVHNITASSSISQDAEYIHNFDNPDGYRVNTESALTAALAAHWGLKASFTWKRNMDPPPGAVRDDTITSMALVVNY